LTAPLAIDPPPDQGMAGPAGKSKNDGSKPQPAIAKLQAGCKVQKVNAVLFW